MTSVSAGHIILTPTKQVGSGRPQRELNPGPPNQELHALQTELLPPRIFQGVNSLRLPRFKLWFCHCLGIVFFLTVINEFHWFTSFQTGIENREENKTNVGDFSSYFCLEDKVILSKLSCVVSSSCA